MKRAIHREQPETETMQGCNMSGLCLWCTLVTRWHLNRIQEVYLEVTLQWSQCSHIPILWPRWESKRNLKESRSFWSWVSREKHFHLMKKIFSIEHLLKIFSQHIPDWLDHLLPLLSFLPLSMVSLLPGNKPKPSDYLWILPAQHHSSRHQVLRNPSLKWDLKLYFSLVASLDEPWDTLIRFPAFTYLSEKYCQNKNTAFNVILSWPKFIPLSIKLSLDLKKIFL